MDMDDEWLSGLEARYQRIEGRELKAELLASAGLSLAEYKARLRARRLPQAAATDRQPTADPAVRAPTSTTGRRHGRPRRGTTRLPRCTHTGTRVVRIVIQVRIENTPDI